MGPRRTHRKSRNGCPQCKARRLKCDERNPCTNCAKHAIQCGYIAPATESVSASPPAVPTSSSNQSFSQFPVQPHPQQPLRDWSRRPSSYSPVGSPNGAHYAGGLPGEDPGHDVLSHLPSAPLGKPPIAPEDWKLDMELIHHYCTVTCDTLTLREDGRHVWRNVMPMEGYQNEFVMHGILAISALHKCHLSTSPQLKKRYREASEIHFAIGAEEFRNRMAADHGNLDAWQSSFSFASLTTVYLAATPIRVGSTRWPSPISDAVDFFASVKGLRAVMEPFHGYFRWSQLSPLSNSMYMGDPTLLGSSFSRQNSQLPQDMWAQLTHLHEFLHTYNFAPVEGDESSDDQRVMDRGITRRKDYKLALKSLEESSRVIELAGPHVERGMVFLWAYQLSKLFQEDMKRHEPAALVLLAHYCICLRIIDSVWFIDNLGYQLLEDIDRNIQPQYRPWLAWPKRHIFEK